MVPGYPSFQQFNADSVLYLRFSPIKKHAKLFYVGSTEKSVMIREHSRFRKYKQMLEDKLVSAALSIRFWAHHQNFWNWCIIPVTDTVPHDLLRGREQALIQTLQPPLNFPFIARWYCPRRGIIRAPDPTCAQRVGLARLWRRHRKKVQSGAGRGLPSPLFAIFDKPSFRSREATWVLLTQLGSNTEAHFTAAKRLRSNEFSYPALCALHRMAKHLPAYMAPNALRAICSAFKFRGFLPPRGHRPLRVPFLSHDTYRQDLRVRMRAYISECKHAITPFHVPKTTVVFPRHPRIAQTLFNHQDALKQWATRKEPTCKCDLIKKYAPKAPTFGGHVAAKGIELTRRLSSLEKQIASGSVTDTFFPDKAQIHTHFLDAWSSWCRTNALPGPPRGLNLVFEQIWDKHLAQVQDRYHREAVDSLKSKTRGTIWHTEDHHPRTAICFCPTLYHRMLEGTFGNPQVFQEVPRTFEEQIKRVQKAAKRDLQRRYPWAFRRTPVIPRAYALPKRKKDFASGRPIVSFVDAFMRPLLEATSRLLHRICSLACPRACSKGDVYELLRQVREFFEFGTAEPLHCRNQDLAGFFNSISQSQFLHAWRITLEFYRQRHGAQPETTFSVNLKEQAQQLRVFRGRRRSRASREVVLWCEDIPSIIRHALALQHFSGIHAKLSPMFRLAHGLPAFARFMRDGHCRTRGHLAHIQH